MRLRLYLRKIINIKGTDLKTSEIYKDITVNKYKKTHE